MPPKGSRKKVQVTLSESEMQILVQRLGYQKQQDLIDDLAMGKVAPAAPPMETPKEIADPVKEKRKSWAEEVEEGEVEGSASGVAMEKKAAMTEKPLTKQWTEIVKGNRMSSNGLELEYVPTEKEVVITEEEWEEGGKQWRYPVVAKVIDSRPSYEDMVKWTGITWKSKAPRVSQLKPGVFLCDFESGELRDEALSRNWMFFSRFSVVFKPWDIDKKVDERMFDSIPIWIQLPGLPPRYWTPRSLSKIASFVGTPTGTDRMTAERTKYAYARIRVEVKSMEDLPETVPVRGPNGTYFEQKVMYEWRMQKCGNCGLLGHDIAVCRRRKKEPDQAVNTGSKKEEVVTPTLTEETVQETHAVVIDKPVTSITLKHSEKGKETEVGKIVAPPMVILSRTPSQKEKNKQSVTSSSAGSPQQDGFTTVMGKKSNSKFPNGRNQGRGTISKPPNG